MMSQLYLKKTVIKKVERGLSNIGLEPKGRKESLLLEFITLSTGPSTSRCSNPCPPGHKLTNRKG